MMKKNPIISIFALAALSILGACQQYLTRSDFVDESAGDAIAKNNVHQMVDPWQPYVYDTNIPTDGSRQAEIYRKYLNGDLPETDAPATR